MTRLTQEQYDKLCPLIDTVRITRSKDGYYNEQLYPKGDYAKEIAVKKILGCVSSSKYIEYSVDPDELIGVFISEKHRVLDGNENSYLPIYPIMVLPLYKIEDPQIIDRINESLEDSDYANPVIKYTKFILVDGALMPLCNVEF